MTTDAPVSRSGTFTLGAGTATAIDVDGLGYGAMRVTGAGIWGPPADHQAALAVIRRAVELGVDFVDTADSYGPFVSEDLIREALHPLRRCAGGHEGGPAAHRPERLARTR